MKVKSSVILAEALRLIESGQQHYVCAAIQDVETQMRWDSGKEISSKAMDVFMTFKPKRIIEGIKRIQEWWPKGDPERLIALKQAIEKAKKQND